MDRMMDCLFLLTLRRLRLGAVCAVALGLLACASPGTPLAPVRSLSAHQVGLQAQGATPAIALAWWQALGDPALDALIDQALVSQPDLQVAAARLAQAQAAAQVQGAAQGVQASASASAMRQRYSAHGIYPPPLAGSWRNSGILQAGASWEWDYFGAQRAALAAALGAQQAQAAELDAARLQLAAQISRSWLGLAQLLAQKAQAQNTLHQRERMLELIAQRVQAGLDTKIEQRQGEGALPDVRAQIEALDEQIQLSRHQLAALSGQGPEALREASPGLPATLFAPQVEALGLDLLGRRPEVQAARWRVEAAQHGIESAQARFYPDIRISAFLGLNAVGLGELLQGSSRELGVGPALHLPLFDAGRLRGQLRGREAEYNAAVAQYNAVVLASVRDAADALASQASVLRQQAQQAQAMASAESAYALAEQRYRAGLGSYLLVLNAESQVLAQRRLAIDLQARLAQSQVALMKSLGGGWQAPALAAASR